MLRLYRRKTADASSSPDRPGETGRPLSGGARWRSRLAALALVTGLVLLQAWLAPGSTPRANADDPHGGLQGPQPLTNIGPQVPLVQSFSQEVRGDYVAAGVGMRNKGSGTINIPLPAGSTITKAFLYWMIIRNTPSAAPNTGTINGSAITGTLVGTSGSPCWGVDSELIDVYKADVTGKATSGANSLTNFPSGLTNGSDPVTNITFPLLEGASLVVVFQNNAFDFNTIVIREGAETFAQQTDTTSFGSFTAASSTATDQAAQTTYIVGDGQARFPADQASFNTTIVAGPTTAVKTADAFDGADGIAFHPLDGLWDTLNLNVSSFFTAGVPTAANPDVVASSTGGDCLTWGAQVLSVKTRIAAGLDIKPGSFPNSINLGNKGVIPVALLGSATFDVSQVDYSSVCFAGDCTINIGPSFQDVNGDGFLDAVMQFGTQEVNLTSASTQACLTGMLNNSVPFTACDSVNIVP